MNMQELSHKTYIFYTLLGVYSNQLIKLYLRDDSTTDNFKTTCLPFILKIVPVTYSSLKCFSVAAFFGKTPTVENFASPFPQNLPFA